ncbi:MAG: hypothetical protein RR428_09780, partial [Coprobacillus sp.]
MFKKFFGKEEDEEEVFETVDPVLEQRRKEKFSAPLIYSEEIKPEIKEEKKVVFTPEKKTPLTAESNYRMSEIISPIDGIKKSIKQEVKVAKPKIKRIKKDVDELIPIISPFYGATNDEEVVETIEHKKEIKNESVADNLR